MTLKSINRLDKDNPQGYFRVLFISDLHSGSNVSAKHPSVVLNKNSEGERVDSPMNKIQKIMWKEWEHMVDVIGHVDLVVHMGDMCDGINKKGEGCGLWSTSIDDQLNNAHLLTSMIDTDRHVGVRGSGYHTKENRATDDMLLERLGGEYLGHDPGPDIDWDMRLEIEDTTWNIRHWISTTKSTFMYRPTKIAREMLLLMQSKIDLGEFDFVVRGHVHTTLYLDMKDSMGMIGLTLPCWKARDDYVKRQITGASDLGWYLFDIDGGKYTRYNHSFHINPKYNIKTLQFQRGNK